MRIIGNDPSIPRQAQIVASGTLSTGDAVVVNADGTVSVVGTTTAPSSTPVFASTTEFTSGAAYQSVSAYDTASNKVVIAYTTSTNNGAGEAVVGTVSGTSVSFGTPVEFSNNCTNLAIAFDINAGKIVVSYRDGQNSLYGTSRVGTVSGTSISFGTAAVFNSARTESINNTYDSNSNKVVVSYGDDGSGYDGEAVVGTVSGTSISFGSKTTFLSGYYAYPTATFDSNSNKVVLSYQDFGNGCYSSVGTVSGTSISFGTKVLLNSGAADSFTSTFDSSNNKVVVLFREDDGSSDMQCVIGNVSGTSISFGTKVTARDGVVYQKAATYNPQTGKVFITYRDFSNSSTITALFATVSGTTATFSSESTISDTTGRQIASVYDPDTENVLVAYGNSASSDVGTSVVLSGESTATNLTSENYIGTAASGAADGTGAKINLKGAVDENQSGLTAGQSYYVQTDGTLGTTPDDPSVFAGTAVAANKLIVKG